MAAQLPFRDCHMNSFASHRAPFRGALDCGGAVKSTQSAARSDGRTSSSSLGHSTNSVTSSIAPCVSFVFHLYVFSTTQSRRDSLAHLLASLSSQIFTFTSGQLEVAHCEPRNPVPCKVRVTPVRMTNRDAHRATFVNNLSCPPSGDLYAAASTVCQQSALL